VLQGFGGGGMQPLAQSIMLESFPPSKHGKAMAIYGLGIVVAPIIGPTLGGWITDSYSWRWIFYINIPFGLLALWMVNANVEDPPYLRDKARLAIDYLGFGLMVMWLASLQLLLDKGQEADWFETPWIVGLTIFSCVALAAFVWRELATRDPILNLRVLGNRDFLTGTVVMTAYSFILYGITAMLPLYLQTLMGYSALDSGMAVSPRGVGAVLSMIVAGWLVSRVDGRLMLGFGLAILTYSTYLLTRINLDITMASIVIPNMINGFAMGFVFVPLTTLTMSRLRKQEIGNAAGVYNLIRNVGGSIGIACVITLLVRQMQRHQSYLGANLPASSAPLRAYAMGVAGRLYVLGASSADARYGALGLVYKRLLQQAALLSYVDCFRFLGVLSLCCAPLALLFHRVKKSAEKTVVTPEH
jgi:MFS transporter, DHA2 family, multidrug resistance protein